MSNEYTETSEETIDFQKLWFILLKWWWLFIVIAALSAGAAYYYSIRQTPIYEATTNILVTRNSSQQSVGDISQSLNLSQLVETYVQMMGTDEFLGVVSARVGAPIPAGNITVAGLTNTQVIELKVQDADPARAARIADMMVVILRERNETLQAGRYDEAEKSLETQITNIETQINDVQAKLDTAKTDALLQQINEAQANISQTVDRIKVVRAELDQLKDMNWIQATFLMREQQIRLPNLQALLDQRAAQRAEIEAKLALSGSGPTPDAATIELLKKQLDNLDQLSEQTRQDIQKSQDEIAFLTPLQTEEGFKAVVIEKNSILRTQESLQQSYQNLYTNLLSTEEVKRTTNEIDGLKRNLALYQQIYLGLLGNREDLKKQKLQNIPTVEQVSPAQASENPVKPRTSLNTLLGALAGFVLAGAVIFLREALDDSVQNYAEIEKILGARVLGYVLKFDDKDGDGIYIARMPRSPVAEAFRSLRTNLEFASKERTIKSLVVTSGNPGEGKTTVAGNLAASLSHSGKKVLLVDADLRRPRVHRYTGLSNETGLSDLLDPEETWGIEDCRQSLTNLPNLQVITSGAIPANPTDLLCSPKMESLLQTLTGMYDYVVIDAPPMFLADPQVLLGLADGVLVVMVPGETRKEAVRAMHEQVAQTGARVVGVVFNRLVHGGRSYGGYGGYGYYYAHKYSYYETNDPEKGKIKIKKQRTQNGEAAGLEETPRKKARTGWILAGVLGVAAVLAAGGFLFRDSLRGLLGSETPLPTLVPVSTVALPVPVLATETALPTATPTLEPPTAVPATSTPKATPTETQVVDLHRLEVTKIPPGSTQAYLIHVVKPGETLEILAAQYQTTVEAIVAVNYTLTGAIWVDYPLVIPVEAKSPAGLPIFQVYTVDGQAQISSTALSDLLGVPASQIELYNLCSGECQFKAGDVLLIPRDKKAE
jgi:capsular exopolysaccharide synthesis family protein